MSELAILCEIKEAVGAMGARIDAVLKRLNEGDGKMTDHERRIRALEDAELARRVRAAVIGALAGGVVIVIEKAVEIYFAK